MKQTLLAAAFAATTTLTPHSVQADGFGVPSIQTGDVNCNNIIDSVDPLFQNNRGGGMIPDRCGSTPQTQDNTSVYGSYTQDYDSGIISPNQYGYQYQVPDPFPNVFRNITPQFQVPQINPPSQAPEITGEYGEKVACVINGEIPLFSNACNPWNIPRKGVIRSHTGDPITCTRIEVDQILGSAGVVGFIYAVSPQADGSCAYTLHP